MLQSKGEIGSQYPIPQNYHCYILILSLKHRHFGNPRTQADLSASLALLLPRARPSAPSARRAASLAPSNRARFSLALLDRAPSWPPSRAPLRLSAPLARRAASLASPNRARSSLAPLDRAPSWPPPSRRRVKSPPPSLRRRPQLLPDATGSRTSSLSPPARCTTSDLPRVVAPPTSPDLPVRVNRILISGNGIHMNN